MDMQSIEEKDNGCKESKIQIAIGRRESVDKSVCGNKGKRIRTGSRDQSRNRGNIEAKCIIAVQEEGNVSGGGELPPLGGNEFDLPNGRQIANYLRDNWRNIRVSLVGKCSGTDGRAINQLKRRDAKHTWMHCARRPEGKSSEW